MARKQKRRATARPRQAVRPAAASGSGSAPVQDAGEPRAKVGGEQALIRAVEMSIGSKGPLRRGGRVVIEPGDPAIPLAQVPYFVPDLIRVGMVGAAMFILLLVASRFIPLFVR